MHWYNYCCIKYKLNKFQLFIKSKWLNDGILLVFSPRMWRWSRFNEINDKALQSFLHVCGGDPKYKNSLTKHKKFSPRMWRWSSAFFQEYQTALVFSTYVEVILYKNLKLLERPSFLHVCGGDPNVPVTNMVSHWFSPRMWRWSRHYSSNLHQYMVFSTYVEVILVE